MRLGQVKLAYNYQLFSSSYSLVNYFLPDRTQNPCYQRYDANDTKIGGYLWLLMISSNFLIAIRGQIPPYQCWYVI